MKILFINLPYQGHVIPTIGLVQELVKQGCDVTYLMPFGWEDKVAESGAIFHGYQNHRQLSEQMKNVYAVADGMIDQFDFVVYEQFFFLGKHLAEKHNKPVARIFTAPVTNEKLMQEFITAKGPLSIFKHKWLTKAFTKDIVKACGAEIYMKTDNWLDEIIHNPPSLNLVYTLQEYQPYAEEFPEEQYKFLGPSVYERKEEAFDFAKGDRCVIYISLGTIVKGATKFFQNCVECFRNVNEDVIISVGKQFDVKKLKNVPSNVHIYKSVPQIQVLKMADVFVTHGGMNSVSEALVAGTPMVVIPFVSDQPVNARCVEKLGVGKCLEYSKVTKEMLREFTNAVYYDLDKRNFKAVRRMIEEAPGNAGGAQMIVEAYEKGHH